MNRARLAANDPALLPARLTRGVNTVSGRLARILPVADDPSERLGLATTLTALVRTDDDRSSRAKGLANLLAEKFGIAVANFARIQVRSAADWNDLAVAQICAAKDDDRPDRWLDALAATDRALALDSALIEARFNRAAIIQRLGVIPVARSQWERYLRTDARSAWSLVARRQLASFVPSDTDSWKAGTAIPEKLSPAELAGLVNRFPQAARRHADGAYLSFWAVATAAGKAAEARTHLDITRAIATVLERRGEPLLSHAVAAIDHATPERRDALVAGHLAYFNGRLAMRDGDLARAQTELRTAVRLLDRGSSPMSAVAEFWLACAFTEQYRASAARERLTSLLSRVTVEAATYPSLIGHIQYQSALIETWSGNWSSAVTAAEHSRIVFESLGERGHAANANAMLSESYDLLGYPERAREHGFIALRESAADGAFDRTRVMLAGLCRTELRGEQWDRARALALVEAELAWLAPDPRLEPDMFIRQAAAEWHLGDEQGANESMRRARDAAKRAGDPMMRAKLVADVDVAEGAINRRRNPRKAIALLSAAVAFQRKSARPIVLPELYLERGRAYLASSDLRAAESDLEAGVIELESQRRQVTDNELRPGIFDDAADLFDELVSIQLRRSADMETIFRSVERGRARSLLEQISGQNDSSIVPSLSGIRDIQLQLDSESALLEYVILPEQLLVFVVTRERAVVRTVAVRRVDLIREVSAFVESKGKRGAALHDILIAPLLPDLGGVVMINVVSNDVLQRVSFPALFDRTTGTYLIERYVVAVSPSAGVLVVTTARARRLSRGKPGSVLVFANPTTPREGYGTLGSLPEAEREGRKIARHYPRASVFIRDAASAERFHELAPMVDLVHFAGHGIVNEREPHASAIVCSSTPIRPGAITSREISKMKFQVTRTVVLAACSTFSGRNAAIEGIPSISRAFLVAGVPSVIGTLWDIEDGDTGAIMEPLHEHLAQGVPPAVALQLVQRAAIDRGLPSATWAAFGVMGSSAGHASYPAVSAHMERH